jgi:trehalose synthase-fused probable maltokinase
VTLASQIADWLPHARWFADKGVALDGIVVHDAVTLPSTDTALALVDVHTATGDRSRYAAAADRSSGADAAATPAFAGWLVRMALTGGVTQGRQGSFIGHPTATLSLPTAPATVTPLGGDASNTSLLVNIADQAYAVKLLRRCHPGIQPEVELGEFFATQAPWPSTPRLYGWLEYASSSGPSASTAIATVHAFAAGCTSGWDRLVALLGQGGLAGSARTTILNIVAALGRTTGEMHRALGSRPDVPEFAPVSATPAERQAMATRMVEHARNVFVLAAARLPRLPPVIGERLSAAIDNRDRIIGQLEGLATLDVTARQIRVHGDYHLGQVLIDNQEHDIAPQVLVIDFEGEPGRSLAERRAKTTACKDVAGMCRSFDYLLRHVAKTTGATYRPDDLEELESCYLDAYRTIACGQPWWPAAPREAAALLAIYKLDKAVYELAYELQNRPDWIAVPLAALASRERPLA